MLIGNLTRDPELRYTPQGTAVCTIGMATNRTWVTDNGEKREETEWHRVNVWGPQAEACGKYLRKGSQVCVEGKMQTRQWEGKDGQTRRTTEIVAERVQLGPKAGGGVPTPAQEGADAAKGEDMPVIDLDSENINPEDLPF